MSYILDALKKVERERARTRHPLVEVAGAPLPARRRLWPWAVAGVLVLNAAVAGVVVARWPAGPAGEPDRTAANAPDATTVTTRPEPSPAPARAETATAPPRVERADVGPAAGPPERVQTAPRPGPSRPEGAATSTPRATAMPSAPGETPPATTTPPAPAPPGIVAPPITTPGVSPQPVAPPAPSPGVVATARPPETARAHSASDLPPGFQTAVAGLKLEVLLYGTTAADRMVFINGRKYVEGQSVDGAVVVERITADGAVLAHEGRRFLLTPSH